MRNFCIAGPMRYINGDTEHWRSALLHDIKVLLAISRLHELGSWSLMRKNIRGLLLKNSYLCISFSSFHYSGRGRSTVVNSKYLYMCISQTSLPVHRKCSHIKLKKKRFSLTVAQQISGNTLFL